MASRVAATKALMEIVTSIHVYSVQLALPTASTGLWQVDSEWHTADYQHLSSVTPLNDNRYAAALHKVALSGRQGGGLVKKGGGRSPARPVWRRQRGCGRQQRRRAQGGARLTKSPARAH